MGAEEKARVPPPPPPPPPPPLHAEMGGWVLVVVLVGVWVCRRTAKWTVMRRISEGSQGRRLVFFHRRFCSRTKHCTHTRSSSCLHIQHLAPIFPSNLLFFHCLPCQCFPPLPFPLSPSPFLCFLLHPPLPLLLTLSTFISLVVSHIPFSRFSLSPSSLPSSPFSPHLWPSSEPPVAQTDTKGKETSPVTPCYRTLI